MAHTPAPRLSPTRESRRLRALRDYAILDTPQEAVFDDIVQLASLFCETPIALVSLVDAGRQWFKAEVGLGTRETPLEASICAHAILEQDLLVVPDTLGDPRFRENPLVAGEPGLRFYAGALLKSPDGMPVGTVCVLDTRPRELTPAQLDGLRRLARQVMNQLELRRIVRDAQRTEGRLIGLIAAAGHDVKAPLRSANYALERIERVFPDAVDLCAKGTRALATVDRQLTQLLAVASTGAQIDPTVTTDLGDVFLVLSSQWTADARRRGISLSLPPVLLKVRGPDALIETLLGNLLSNAMKNTPGGGRVDVTAKEDADQVAITVADNGVGIAADRQVAIFDAFRQVDPEAEGLGLGLWIVGQIAASLQATVQVESEQGKGSRFTVRLPKADRSQRVA